MAEQFVRVALTADAERQIAALGPDDYIDLEGSVNGSPVAVRLYSAELATPGGGPTLVAAVLTAAQQKAVDFYRALNVPAAWFIGEPQPDGSVEVLALGNGDEDAPGFVWTIRIEAGGDTATSECRLDADGFSTGIEV